MTQPTIRIKDAWLLREAASVPLNELWGDGERLDRDVTDNQKNNATDYLNAWNYVDEHGYQEIITKLQKLQ